MDNLRTLLLLMTVLCSVGVAHTSKSFCAQFFKDTVTKEPLMIPVKDNKPVGTILKRYRLPTKSKAAFGVKLLGEGSQYFHYNNRTHELSIKQMLHKFVGKRLVLKARCRDFWDFIHFYFPVPVEVWFDVSDGNDPPSFTNLPNTLILPEDVRKGRVVYVVEAGNMFDITPHFMEYDVGVLSVTTNGKEDQNALLMLGNRVILNRQFDFEAGVREIIINLVVKDTHFSDSTESSLTLTLKDVDDMGPAFAAKDYYIPVLGEKPVMARECLVPEPNEMAKDQDIVAISPLGYTVVTGSPSNWTDFFELDADTGILCQIAQINRTILTPGRPFPGFHNFTFVIQAYQKDNQSKQAEAALHVHVCDRNLHAPEFDPPVVDAAVMEWPRVKKGELVAVVTAFDKDYGRNSFFRYEFDWNPEAAFALDEVTGEVTVVRPDKLDRERRARWEIRVNAIETQSYNKRTSRPPGIIDLRLTDLNDNPPIFTKEKYEFSINDSHEAGVQIHKSRHGVLAQDADAGPNARIRYKIYETWRTPGPLTSQTDTDLFQINENGAIKTSKSLRFLRRQQIFPTYRLVIVAYDQPEKATIQKTATTEAFVHVFLANEHRPVLNRDELHSEISEGVPMNTIVARIQATDKDGDEDVFLNYKLVGAGGKGRFRLDKAGELRTAGLLDRERDSEYKLGIRVDDGKFTTEGVFTVRVIDINDNPPYFSKRSYRFFVSENITSLIHIRRKNGNGHNGNGMGGQCHFEGDPIMATLAKDAAIGRVKAVDPDGGDNGKIAYRLMSGVGSELFCIDKDGSIYVVMNDNNIMDKEKNDRISLIVEATDSGSPPLKDIVSVTIILTDVNDNPPVFNFPEYTGFVTEDDEEPLEDQEVFLEREMTVTDADKSSRNNNHRFSIHGHGSELFTIDPKSGAMSVKVPGTIDCETSTLYEFMVVATDRKGTGLSGNATILIYVDDVNEFAPRFLNRYSFTLAANTPVGHVFGKLEAEDYDITPQNKQVTYLLTAGGGNKFALDYETGELRVDGDLNEPPARQRYNLTINAVDTGKPRKSTTEMVTVHVKLNNPPEFWNGHAYSVRESDLPGTVIGEPRVHDPDSATDANLVVSFHVKDDPELPFTVDTDRGSIILMRAVDREEHDEIQFMMYAVDNGAPPATGSALVTVNILDDNDNPPMFSKSQYYGTVVEDDSKPLHGQEVKMSALIKATDKDVTEANRDIRFSLMGEGHEVFEIDPIIGTISVKQPGRLDAETQPVFKLQVIATDQGGDLEGLASAAMLTVNVDDVNDNAPRFQRRSYSFMVLGNSTIGTQIGKVQATDADESMLNNEVLYILQDGGYGRFSIGLETGMLTVANWLDSQPALLQYKLVIQAVDKGFPPMNTHVEVNIALPDNLPPVFDTSLTFHIMENKAENTIVGKIRAFDPEEPSNKTMTFFLEDEAGSFIMQPSTGTLFARDSFDREKVERFEVPIFVVDSGAPAETSQAVVTVIVDDVNDNGPKFTRARFDGGVKEDDTIPISKHDHKVQMHIPIEATDDDATEENRYLQYSVEGNDARSFKIDSLTGQLEVARPGIIDCEKKQQYKFKVVVTDSGGLSASTLVHVTVQDVNDNAPVFLKDLYRIRLTDDIVGQVIGKVSAADQDRTEVNNRVIYDLEKGGAGRFSINSQTGEIQVMRSLVDEPVILKYNLAIRAIDTGLPQKTGRTTVIVTIPVNNPPVVPSAFKFSVVENVPSATVVGKVEAEDRDTDGGVNATKLHFSIKNDGLVPFKIDRATGVITTLGEVDSEKAESYVLIVQVGDQGIPPKTAMSKVKVFIEDVNDNSPAFTKDLYTGTVTEDDKVPIENQVVAMDNPIEVNDADASEENRNIVYKLYGEKSHLFVIDQKTGVLRVKKAGTIDCEEDPTFSLVLSATDAGGNGLTTKAEVKIKVIDVNDNPPSFLVTNRVFEVNGASPAKIAEFAAVDNDASPMNNRVIYLLEGGYGKFSLDQISGNLMANDFLFREPLLSEYVLKVRALDTGNPGLSSETEITVKVPKNVAPKIVGNKRFVVREGLPSGTRVGKVEATDTVKLGEISKFMFKLDDESNDHFKIDPDTGSIATKVTLDRETSASYNLVVTVSDYGSPRMSTSATFTVLVEDINDNAPLFNRKAYRGKIRETKPEDSGVQQIILDEEIELIDLDDVSGSVRITLEGYGRELFTVDKNTLTVWKKEGVLLDCEEMKMYNLTIRVRDTAGGLDLQSRANLRIDVKDINDNKPVFERERYHVFLKTGSSVGSRIARIEAKDADISDENNEIMYFLKKGGEGRFTVDVFTGELIVSGSLGQEPIRPEYTLHIEAIDRGRPPLTGKTTVVITVPANHAPEINGPIAFRLTENQPIGTLIGFVNAFDVDETPGEENLNYTILDKSVPFFIHASGGPLQTSQTLDYEKQQFYSFSLSVQDKGTPVRSATAQVNITIDDVNDVAPKFNQSWYDGSLMEDDFQPIRGQHVEIKGLPIAAWDGDGTEENRQILFYLKGEGSELLNMDPLTGVISVRTPGSIDADRRQYINLTVIATDRNGTGQSSWVPLYIKIEDHNDNAPEFEQSVYVINIVPSLDIGSVVTTLTAIDKDGTDKANRVMYILERNGYGKFHVDFLTGDLIIMDNLSREPVASNYTLMVKAFDNGSPSKSAKTKVIVNVPDNIAPIIDKSGPFNLKENEPAGTIVGNVNAHDPNATAPVIYSLRDRRVPFKIDESTGMISTTAPVDRERNDMYDIEVLVTDRGSPKMTSTALVYITIDDVDDNPPIFHQLVYEGHVAEGPDAGRADTHLDIIMAQTVSAYDEDVTDENQQFLYSLEGVGAGQFQINVTSGMISVEPSANLDADYQDHYNLVVVATGINNKQMQSKIPLRITVDDVNDNAPIFAKAFYDVKIRASTAKGSVIETVQAKDMDVSTHNGRVYYFLTGGYGKFLIHKLSGEITVADSLSREPAFPIYCLVVTAIDGGQPSRSSTTKVNVTLPWNNAPEFTESKYEFDVREGALINTKFGKVLANDIDHLMDEKTELAYYIEDDQVPFTVHEKTGVISTTRVIDREEEDKYRVKVNVRDNGSPSKTASSVLVVYVIDINDNPPSFSHKLYEGRVMENDYDPKVDKTVVFDNEIWADDTEGQSKNNKILYALLGPGSELFKLVETNGRISLEAIGVIDYETTSEYNFQVEATDQGGKGLKSSADVKIKVLDANDHPPVFKRKKASFSIKGETPIGSNIGALTASDGDTGDSKTRTIYVIRSGGFGKFRMDFYNGTIFVADQLGREPIKSTYELDVEAIDSTNRIFKDIAKVFINVPTNKPPLITGPSEIHVAENKPIGTTIGRVLATDPDPLPSDRSPLLFSILERRAPVAINSKTGILTIKQTLDREDTKEVTFTVEVKDKGSPEGKVTSEIRLVVDDVNDNPPEFSEAGYHGAVLEDDKKPHRRQAVLMKSMIRTSDSDATQANRQVVYSLLGRDSRFFSINPSTAKITVNSRGEGKIDREKHDRFKLKVAATDQSGKGLRALASVIIHVEDMNDNAPEFTNSGQAFVAKETVKAGDVIGKIEAIDLDATSPNNDFIYLVQNDAFGKFRVDMRTGEVIALEGLYYQPRQEEYILNVVVVDKGTPSLEREAKYLVRVMKKDFIDQKPEFTGRTSFLVDEERRVGSKVGQLTLSDRSGSGSRISLIKKPNEDVPFQVDSSGSIYTTGRLDADTKRYHEFQVKAADANGASITTFVSIYLQDLNDNPPKFPQSEYRHMVYAAFPEGTVVATPFAYDDLDDHRSEYEYSLSGGYPGYFNIDRRTGKITTTKKLNGVFKETYFDYTIAAFDSSDRSLGARAKFVARVIPWLPPPSEIPLVGPGGVAPENTTIPDGCPCCRVFC